MKPELEVVYKAHVDTVEQIVHYLKSYKCNPVVLDDPSTTLQHVARWHAKVRIAVPADQVKKARESLIEFEMSKSGNVDELDRQVKKDVVKFIGIYAMVAAGLYWLYKDLETSFSWGIFISLAIVILWSNWGRIVRAVKKQ